jgi:beta-glucanase (GH16 family)
METTQLEWSGYKWITNERWGQWDASNPRFWMDPSAVSIHKGTLHLTTHLNKKTFTTPTGETYTATHGMGTVSCLEKFGYGEFEIEARLPYGSYNWPAFWMWSWDSWPPEIDIFEGYSNKNGSYFNWADFLLGKIWRVESNIHLGKHPYNYSIGAESARWGWKNPHKHFIKYSLLWTPDVIEIKWDGKVVRKITDKSILAQFENTKMNVLINNWLQKDLPLNHHQPSLMQVKYFKYKQL